MTGWVSWVLQTLECADKEIDAKIVDTQTVQKEVFDKVGALVKDYEDKKQVYNADELKKIVSDTIKADYKHLESRIYEPALELSLNQI